MVYNFFDKKTAGSGVNIWANNGRLLGLATQKLAEELHKPIINKFKTRTFYSRFKDNIWGCYLADMQLIKDLDFYCALVMFLVNILGFFL